MTDSFEVRNEKIEGSLREVGRAIAGELPEGWGFCLFIFDFAPKGSLFFLSTAERADMLKLLEEFIERQERP